jgi:predicted amidohydrolase
MTSVPQPEVNLSFIESQVSSLVSRGAQWIVTPENAIVFGTKQDYHAHAEFLGQGPVQKTLSDIARKYSVWLVAGSFPIRTHYGVTTTMLIYNNHGELAASYDKLHMFDVDVEDNHRRYRESEIFQPGDQIQVVSTPFGELGLSICYDIRFPHLYSALRNSGAQIILVPAAFTAVTGRAHWEVLLRARAIETQCWIVAVNQGGIHPGGRETWGHSMVIDPWGNIVAGLDQVPENLIAQIDLGLLNEIRTSMPVFTHSRFENHFLPKKSEL